MIRMNRWNQRFMELAKHISTWSKDRSTKVGCVVVGPDNEIRSTGYNGFPRGVNDNVEARHARPEKYKWTEHAERNAIYNAVRAGVSLDGCCMYLCWFPCVDCARAIIQSGISDLLCCRPDFDHPRWGDDFRTSHEMFSEAGVNVIFLEE